MKAAKRNLSRCRLPCAWIVLALTLMATGPADDCYAAQTNDTVKVVSFNIQFLGSSKERRNEDLADLLAPFDLVFIQELVAPPYSGRFPDGTPYQPDPDAAAFFDAMRGQGFQYALSEEDTGTGPKIHLNSTATEWWVAFYKPRRVKPASQLPSGFLSSDRSDNRDYERVPYAFAFKMGGVDMVFISVHLQPGTGPTARSRRAQELGAIYSWIGNQHGSEHDYVILGDMNIEDCTELRSVLRSGFASLNNDCRPTNTNVNSPKPYDHVIYNERFSAREVSTADGLQIIDLVKAMQSKWPPGAGPYPGSPYDHDRFRKFYSDHDPVEFVIKVSGPDDD
jgi:endonuclease/exonuclease/phosphatase family metal-dependent hydrolase